MICRVVRDIPRAWMKAMTVEAEVPLVVVHREMRMHWTRASGTREVVWRCCLLGDQVSFWESETA